MPYAAYIFADGSKVLARYYRELVRERRLFAATFHPELTSDRRVYALVFGGADEASRAA